MELRKVVEKNQPCKKRIVVALRFLSKIIAPQAKQVLESGADDEANGVEQSRESA